ncbi:hypothetical protein PQX77_000012 [Marasmius sp. AFHP31]|nr:hypothetical protein PQX77_000012 [Marasmius sp. AFHP31]
MAPSTSSPPRNSATESSTEKASTNTAHNNSHPPKQSKPKVQIPPPTKPLNAPIQQKKPHRKPIIDWFQRKLGGNAKGKRVVDESLSKGNGRVSGPQRSGSRVVTPGQPATIGPGGRQQTKMEAAAAAAARRKTVSLNGDDDIAQYTDRHSDEEDDRSLNESDAQESVWSPNSVQEADEDASLRPLPPSSPPSPSPSRSSSSYLSDPRTFKSIAASTKPTTLLSIDLHGNGMAHIAQAPLTPTRYAHARSSSNATNPNISGQVPPSPQTSSRPVSFQDPLTIITTPNATTQQSGPNSLVVQAPLHTTHHPRNNPRPLSPPPDDASVLTLASSAYAIPGLRVAGVNNWSSPPSAIGGGGDSVSHFGGTYADVESTSQLDDDRLDDRDADASVRALRPRSTRRGSWESEASRWSARIQVTGPPSLGGGRERSLWTSNSIRTGTLSTENVDTNGFLDDVADGATGVEKEEKETEREASSQATVEGQEEVGADDNQGDADVSKQQPAEELVQAKDKEDDDRPAVDHKVSSDTVNSPTRATADEREGKDEAPQRHEPIVAEEKEPAEPEKIQIVEATDETPKVSEHMEATQAKLVVVRNRTPEGAAESEGEKFADSPVVPEGKEVAVTQSPVN